MDVYPVRESAALRLPLNCHTLLHLLYHRDAGEWNFALVKPMSLLGMKIVLTVFRYLET